MIGEKQKFLKERGEVGDCWRCCIAALINLPIDDVPHFQEIQDKHEGSAIPDAQVWLNERGYILISVNNWQDVCPPAWGSNPVTLPYIASGPTIRSKSSKDKHACVYIYEKLVYDPHPSDVGLLAITDREIILPMLPNTDLFKVK